MDKSAGAIVIGNIGQLLTMAPRPDGVRPDSETGALGLVEDAMVVVRDGLVAGCGRRHELEPLADIIAAGREPIFIDAAGGVVTPGLIDPHTHLLFCGWREAEFTQRLEGRPYLDILAAGGGILHTVSRFRAASDADLLEWGRAALDRMLLCGTTTVEAKSGYGLSAEEEIRALSLLRRLDRSHPVTIVPTFLGAHAVPPEYRARPDPARSYLEEVCIPLLPRIALEGLAVFCDVFCEAGVFDVDASRRLLDEASRRGLRPKLHADELEATGGAELAAEVGAISADHLVQASDRGLGMMAQAGVVAVLLPATTFTLGHTDYAPARRMLS